MEDNNYYVYRHIRLDTDTPFYVGKGKKDRLRCKRRNSRWTNIVNKAGFRVEIILYGLTEVQAFSKESEFIQFYKSFGFCEANMTLGGEGSSGYKQTPEQIEANRQGQFKRYLNGGINPMRDKSHTVETKLKMSESHKNIQLSPTHCEKISLGLKGKPKSEGHRRKLSESKKGTKRPPDWVNPKKGKTYINAVSREIIDSEGTIWPSISSFCKVYGIRNSSIYRYLKSGKPYKGLVVQYYEEATQSQKEA